MFSRLLISLDVSSSFTRHNFRRQRTSETFVRAECFHVSRLDEIPNYVTFSSMFYIC